MSKRRTLFDLECEDHPNVGYVYSSFKSSAELREHLSRYNYAYQPLQYALAATLADVMERLERLQTPGESGLVP